VNHSKYVWDIEQRNKERLMKLAEFHYNSASELAESLPTSKGNYRNHKSGEKDALSAELAEGLLSIVNRSEFRFSNYDLENEDEILEIAEKEFIYGGEEKVGLNANLQSALLTHHTGEEIKEMLGGSKSQARKAKRGEIKSVPTSVLPEILKYNEERLNTEFNPEGDIRYQGFYSNRDESIIEDADHEDISRFNQARRDLRSLECSDDNIDTRIYRGILENPEPIEDIVENVEEGTPTIDMNNYGKESGFGLREIGVLERWGGQNNSNHTIEVEDSAYLKALLSEAHTNEIERYPY